MLETSAQCRPDEQQPASSGDVTRAGIVLFDALARFQAGETKSGLRCLQQLQQSRSFATLVDALCPGLSTRSDKRSRRIRRLLPEASEGTGCGEASDLRGLLSAQIPSPDELTFKQRTVLRLVLDGCSNIEISNRLAISTNTVKWHLKGIFRQLGVENRCSALKVARLRNLI
ncbi:MAG: regulatory protein LuxR [Nevskia sp.]|nr:regulatory protein LuxR [Nevskia sp.]